MRTEAGRLVSWISVRTVRVIVLTLSTQQAKLDNFSKSKDTNEMARNEPSHQDLNFLLFFSWFYGQQWT